MRLALARHVVIGHRCAAHTDPTACTRTDDLKCHTRRIGDRQTPPTSATRTCLPFTREMDRFTR
jgi:hypothetical protein